MALARFTQKRSMEKAMTITSSTIILGTKSVPYIIEDFKDRLEK